MSGKIEIDNVFLATPPTKQNLFQRLNQRINPNPEIEKSAMPKYILNGIDLKVVDGESVALIGENGAGKSMLLKTISGVLEPSKGTVVVDGKLVSLINLNLGINVDLTGRENVFIRLLYMGYGEEYGHKHMEEIRSFCDLKGYFDKPVKTYSAGMVARLGFSISTCIVPDIIIMDEWIGAGDASFVDKASARVKNLVGRSKIIVFATHSESTIREWATRLLWIKNGTIHADGSPDIVLPEYQKYVRDLKSHGRVIKS